LADADIVILALPLNAMAATLKSIAPILKPGALVTDTASLKLPVLQWAREFLPSQVHFVGGNPILNPALALEARTGPEAASPDLFAGGLYGLMPSANCAPEALQLASDLVALLRATPFYPDPAEHDGLMAAIEGLPGLLSLALMRTAARSPAWREARKLADHPFNTTTSLVERDPAGQRDLLLHNRDNVVRWLDAMLAELSDLRQLLLEGDAGALEQAMRDADDARRLWLNDRRLGTWEPKPDVELPTTGQIMSHMVGFDWRRRKKQ
jgi:prephenate dehydrogenase